METLLSEKPTWLISEKLNPCNRDCLSSNTTELSVSVDSSHDNLELRPQISSQVVGGAGVVFGGRGWSSIWWAWLKLNSVTAWDGHTDGNPAT